MTDIHTIALLTDAFGRVRELVQRLTDDLEDPVATFRVDSEANTPAWLLWHLTRIQDDHVAELAGVEQAWTSWRERFDLPLPPTTPGSATAPRKWPPCEPMPPCSTATTPTCMPSRSGTSSSSPRTSSTGSSTRGGIHR